MFKCDNCGCSSGARESPNKVVTGVRNVQYVNNIKNKEDKIVEKVSQGWEIVSEEQWCLNCRSKLKSVE